MTDAKELRFFFDIRYQKNLGNILDQFAVELGGYIPTEVNAGKSQTEKDAIVHMLSKKDSDDPSRTYCYAVKRNPAVKDTLTEIVRQQWRSPYNDNKTRVLRKTLYDRLGRDNTLSFCYSDDPAKSRTDEEIISNWATKKADGVSTVPSLKFTISSFEYFPKLWYNTCVNNSDLLVGRSGWLFMCGLHPLSQ